MHGPDVHMTIIDSMHHMQKHSQGLTSSQPVTVAARLRALYYRLGQRQCITEIVAISGWECLQQRLQQVLDGACLTKGHVGLTPLGHNRWGGVKGVTGSRMKSGLKVTV